MGHKSVGFSRGRQFRSTFVFVNSGMLSVLIERPPFVTGVFDVQLCLLEENVNGSLIIVTISK